MSGLLVRSKWLVGLKTYNILIGEPSTCNSVLRLDHADALHEKRHKSSDNYEDSKEFSPVSNGY